MRNQIKTLLLLGVLSAILVGIGGFLAPGMTYLFAGLALAMNLGAYFFSDRLVLRMSGAREVTPAQAPMLHRVVEELALRAGMPKPRVCVIPGPHANAFATGRSPAHGVVAVTEGLLAILSERELRGVLAHELAHIKNRDILIATVAAGLATAVSYLANMLSFAAFFGGAGSEDEEGASGGGLLAAMVAPIVALLVQMGVSRSREFLADETGARISGDPEGLACALTKLERAAQDAPASLDPATASLFIVNPLRGEAVMNLLSTHPPMRRRIERLQQLAREPWRLAA